MGVTVNALLSLEPRVAGEDVLEPAIDPADERHDLRMECLCESSDTIATITYACLDHTKIC
jgi:hypothetical protein